MVEKIGHIKNPLTVIAIFAAIAEISGTTVLPFIEADNQNIYIWFLMFFPIFLVGIFFLTLNFNHRVLYAPSDYKDEKNFVNPYGKASPEEQGNKLREEVEEIEAEGSAEKSSATEKTDKNEREAESTHDKFMSAAKINSIRNRQLMADVTLAEKLAVNKLTKELGLNFKTDVRLEFPDSNVRAVYDALAIDDDEVHAVEVKLFKARHVDPSRLAKVLEQSELAAQSFRGIDPRNFTLHIFAVMDTPEVEMAMLKHNLESFAKRYKVKVKIHITTLDDLQNEYQYNP
ncbi:hypothetical protein [Pseudomaricurvus alcaniphilus]|uniref:hypothetical protein n=1 Tax=Pseudomaricurvus alcaniphilus TaxID=1166482 RepID=UPI001A9FE8D9|nr:hypothetical protein [Pseudomaricurvus alcaniphilus]